MSWLKGGLWRKSAALDERFNQMGRSVVAVERPIGIVMVHTRLAMSIWVRQPRLLKRGALLGTVGFRDGNGVDAPCGTHARIATPTDDYVRGCAVPVLQVAD